MKTELLSVIAVLLALFSPIEDVSGCTSAIIGRQASRSGRMMLWKHRDSGFPDNFVGRVERTDSTLAYVGLFNAGDSLMREVWIGFNEAGFAVMNTASYNLTPDTAALKDCEGLVMSRALKVCHTVADFDSLLRVLPKPLGVQANFGVIDAAGNGAYFETGDWDFKAFPLSQVSEHGYLIRTNYSCSGGTDKRLGEARFDVASRLMSDMEEQRGIAPSTLIDTLSCSLLNGRRNVDYAMSGLRWIADEGDMIPRRSSCASVVIEGPLPGEDSGESTRMWTVLGFPAVSPVVEVRLDSVPAGLLPSAEAGHSPLCDEANRLRGKVFRRKDRRGKWMIDLLLLKKLIAEKQRRDRSVFE